MDKPLHCNTRVMELLTQKASIKLEVFRKSKDYFEQIKEVVKAVTQCVSDEVTPLDGALKLEYKEISSNECELHFGGDVLVFNMHTNVFTFDSSHRVWQTGYVKEDRRRAYFAVIHVYNFLADSFKYNRQNDTGILMARLFVNREGHFFVEGKRQLGFLYNQLGQQKLDGEHIKELVDTAMICSLEHDLTVPDYKESMVVSVRQIQALSSELQTRTAKKVGMGYYPRMKKD